MTKRKKVTILILVGVILIAGGVLGWAVKSGKISPRADVAGALVPMPINLRVINPPPQTFDDVPPTHWAYKYIEGVARNGLTLGCTSNLEQTTGISKDYCPDMNTSMRQQLATFAVRMLLKKNPSAPVCTSTANCPLYFQDVNYSYAYGSIIQTAKRNNLFRNMPVGGYFYPNAAVTRSEIENVIYDFGNSPTRPSGDPSTCTNYSCTINRAQMAGYFSSTFRLTFTPYDADAPVLLDWDEPQVNTEDQTIGFQIWRKGPSDTAPQLIWTIDAAPDVGEGLENPSAGGNVLDADFPANSTGSYTYYVCAFDSGGDFSGSADGSTADSGICYNPATLTLTVKSGG